MSRIKLSKYQEPLVMKWEEAGLSECYDYYPEKEFYYFSDSKPVKIGEMEYMDSVLLQFFATKEDIVKGKSDMFQLNESETRKRLINSIWSIRHSSRSNTLDYLCERVENDHNKYLDMALENFKSLDHDNKVEKFRLDYPRRFKAWCKDRDSDMPVRKMSDDRLNKLYAHYQKGDYQLLYDVMPLDELSDSIQDYIDKNHLTLTEKAKEFYGKRLYSYESRYLDEEDSWWARKRRMFHKRIAWKKFIWWQKHELFNTAEYVVPCPNDDRIESLSDLYYRVRYQVLHIWNKYFHPQNPLLGYLDGPYYFTEMAEKALTSTALYMFYFGHIVHATQRKSIRQMWEARRLLRKAAELDDRSFSREIEDKVRDDWLNGKSVSGGKVKPLTVKHMSYFKDTDDGTGCSEMMSTWIAEVTGLPEDERKSIRKESSRFGDCIVKKTVKGQVFADLAVDYDREYVELNDSYQEILEKDRGFYYEKWSENIRERIDNAYTQAFKYIGKNCQGWSD